MNSFIIRESLLENFYLTEYENDTFKSGARAFMLIDLAAHT